MLLKYPGLTLAGGLALAIAIAVGAGWYDLSGKLMAPEIPLPEGDRLVLIETQNTLTGELEPRVVRDFLDWRRDLRTIEGLGAYRTQTRNLTVGNAAPQPVRLAELTAAAFGGARVSPVLGRALLDSDASPGAPGVLVLGYDVWQRSFGGRPEAIGSMVKLGNAPATVIGIMPSGFRYPVNHDAWTPMQLRASYEALEGGSITVIGRLAPGVSLERANAEVRVHGERAAKALPATHGRLHPGVKRLGQSSEGLDVAQLAQRNLPVLLVLSIACMSVGTLVYARTATRESEMAVRSALGASRARIIGQLFVEALVLASVAAGAGLMAAGQAVTWVSGNFNQASGGAPFWVTPGLKLSTILYGAGLALVCAAMLSLLPALKVTRAAGMQRHLVNRGSGASLRFGNVWTAAMIVQVALTAIGIPLVIETAIEAARNLSIRGEFPSRGYVAARIEVDREDVTRLERTLAELQRRIAQQPGVAAVTYADRAPGSAANTRRGEVWLSGSGSAFQGRFCTSAVGPEFFEAFDRPIVSGRAFHGGDFHPSARAVIVNEAFARALSRDGRSGSPIGARLRYAASAAQHGAAEEPWFEIVGMVRDIGLDPDDWGAEKPFVFHAAQPSTLPTLVMSARVRGETDAVAARLPFLAADVDAGWLVKESRPLNEWVRDRDMGLIVAVAAQAAVTGLALFLSSLSIFSQVSVAVSRRTYEIGIRAALGAGSRDVLTRILSRAIVLIGSGLAAGGALLLGFVAMNRPAGEVALYAGYFGATSVIVLTACLLACIGPAARALRIHPADALREA